MRTVKFAQREYYHCYNRGVDKRNIFMDKMDYQYFMKSLYAYNTNEVRGKLRLHNDAVIQEERPISIMAFCLNSNHYHLLIRENTEGGISKFMQRVGTGYTMFFNQRYDRSGSLFQGKFKATHIQNDEKLRHISAYVNLNNLVHNITDLTKYRTSFPLYTKEYLTNSTQVRGKASNLSLSSKICSDYNFLIETPELYDTYATSTVAEIIQSRKNSELLETQDYLE